MCSWPLWSLLPQWEVCRVGSRINASSFLVLLACSSSAGCSVAGYTYVVHLYVYTWLLRLVSQYCCQLKPLLWQVLASCMLIGCCLSGCAIEQQVDWLGNQTYVREGVVYARVSLATSYVHW
jgi:hypothetical protein